MASSIESPNRAEIEYWNSAATRPCAQDYEAIDRLFHEITATLLRAAEVRPGERVLDVGCGSGSTLLELASRTGPGGRALGIDVSRQSVEQANHRLAAAGLAHAEAIVAD